MPSSGASVRTSRPRTSASIPPPRSRTSDHSPLTTSLRTAKQGRPDKATQQKELGGKLLRVFRPDQIGRLTSRAQGRTRAEVQVRFYGSPKSGFNFRFAFNSSTDVTLDKTPEKFFEGGAVFFSAKEMRSMFRGFAELYDNVSIEIDETYADLCRALGLPLLRGPRHSGAG